MEKHWLIPGLLLLLVAGCAVEAPPPAPIHAPPTAENSPPATDPAPAVGIDPASFDLVAEYNAAQLGISLLVMLDGEIVFEDYPNQWRPGLALELASGTKSFSGAMAVAAAADGLLDIDEPVSKTLTEWRDLPGKSVMTLRQLLSLTGGVETGGERGQVPTYAAAIETTLFAAPGEAFRYGAVPVQIFGEVMRRKLIDEGLSPLEYLQLRVFDPIGLEPRRWRHGDDGNPNIPSGAALTAREWALYGELIRLEGNWQGNQVLPAELLEECFRGSVANPAYGLSWWLNREVPTDLRATIPQLALGLDDLTRVPGIPGDLVFAAGAGNQRLYVSHEAGLVVVRQATGIVAALNGESQSDFSDAVFLTLLLRGLPASVE